MRIVRYLIVSAVCALFLATSACGNGNGNGNASTVAADSIVKVANGLTISCHDSYTVVEVKNPWKPGELLHTYVLVPRDEPLPADLPAGTVVRTPITNAVVYSSVHGGVMKELGALAAVKGVCDAKYFTMPEVQKGLAEGTIADVGNSLSPTVERIVAMKPDAIILSPFQNAGYGAIEKIGVPIIECADYMENTPIGRAEWIKLFGELLGKSELADSIFASVEVKYDSIRAIAADVKVKPKVISDMEISGVWYVPGGDSYMAHLFEDAGADYPWRNDNNTGSLSLSIAQVLDKASDADFWLLKWHIDLCYTAMEDFNHLNSKFKAYKEKHIYQCNTERVPLFAEFPFHPDLLLKDFVALFHPELLPGYTTRYYKPLIDE